MFWEKGVNATGVWLTRSVINETFCILTIVASRNERSNAVQFECEPLIKFISQQGQERFDSESSSTTLNPKQKERRIRQMESQNIS